MNKELREKVMLLIRNSEGTLQQLSDELIALIGDAKLDEVKEAGSRLYRNGELDNSEQEIIDTVERVMNDYFKAIDNLKENQ